MYVGKTLFAQLMEFLPWTSFQRCVQRYGGDYRVRTLRCAEHFRVMAFAQLTYRESLRDIEACLSAHASKLYHLGFREPIRRSTLADANETRDWRIYAEFAQRLIERARKLYAHDSFGVELDHTVYALDSTTIELCLSTFPWAAYCARQAGLRVHTLLDLRGAIPSFIHLSDAKTQDVTVLDLVLPEPGAFYVMDRAYLDLERLYALDQAGSFFITRAKRGVNMRRVYSQPVDRSSGLICDQRITFLTDRATRHYPAQMRRIRYRDPLTDQNLVFLTNHTLLPALTICTLYKSRWQVELFFKWIKHHLRIQRFYGTSANAVKTQLWIAMATYVLIAIIKKELKVSASLHTLLQILSLTLFEKMPLQQAFADLAQAPADSSTANQLTLFDS